MSFRRKRVVPLLPEREEDWDVAPGKHFSSNSAPPTQPDTQRSYSTPVDTGASPMTEHNINVVDTAPAKRVRPIPTRQAAAADADIVNCISDDDEAEDAATTGQAVDAVANGSGKQSVREPTNHDDDEDDDGDDDSDSDSSTSTSTSSDDDDDDDDNDDDDFAPNPAEAGTGGAKPTTRRDAAGGSGAKGDGSSAGGEDEPDEEDMLSQADIDHNNSVRQQNIQAMLTGNISLKRTAMVPFCMVPKASSARLC
jgi:hypothetical protein